MQVYKAFLVSSLCIVFLHGSDSFNTAGVRELIDQVEIIKVQKQKIKELEDKVDAQALLIQDLNWSFNVMCEVNKKICKQRNDYSAEAERLLSIAESAQKAIQHWRDKYLNYHDRVEKTLNMFIVLGIAYTVFDLYSQYVVKYT